MLSIGPPTSLIRSHDGFTLIETLVAIVTGLVVMGAAFTILDVALHQSSRLTDRVQAQQAGRTTMTQIVDDLRSTCLYEKDAPVLEKSTPEHLWFVDGYGEQAVLTKAYEHEIEWTGNASKPTEPGKLTDKAYPSTSSSTWPKFEFEKTDTETLLGENIYKTELSKTESPPIFEYLKYTTAAGGTSTTAESTLTPIPLIAKEELKEKSAEVAAVQINFTAAPHDNETALNRSAPLNTEVTFALGSPSSEATIKDGPCQ